MRYFHQFGSLVEQRWRDANYNEEAFPELAAQALSEMDSTAAVSPWDIIRSLGTDPELPPQREDKFSDLPIVLYNAPRFRVEAYYWLDGTTSVHQHGFSGAFQVMLGSSIHSHYTFKSERVINAHFSTGKLLLKEVQVLKKGDIKKILPGHQYIHSLFHLDRPSVTLTVRTHQTPNALPQYDYLKPYFAVNPFFEEQLTFKKIKSASLLLRMKHPDAYTLIDELITSSDCQTAFMILGEAFSYLIDDTRDRLLSLKAGTDAIEALPAERKQFNELFKKARRRHGTIMNFLLPVLNEMHRDRTLIYLRKYMTSSEHRFFLALILNIPDRELILDLVAQRLPHKNPVDIICDWVKEFSAMRNPKSPERNILGIDDFGDVHLFVFRRLLEGHSIEQISDTLEKDYALEEAEKFKGELGKMYQSFQRSVLLNSILSKTPFAADSKKLLRASVAK